ncbi:MAG: hypothetical protein ACLU4J_05900 [Butyricimonas paravirosa]
MKNIYAAGTGKYADLSGRRRKPALLGIEKNKEQTIGNNVYLRGLIEISNICTKDCFYCGIRKSNTETARYALSDKEILDAADFAYIPSFRFHRVTGWRTFR